MWQQTYFARIVSQSSRIGPRKIRDPKPPEKSVTQHCRIRVLGVLNLPERQG
jgi:hypothetical protein